MFDNDGMNDTLAHLIELGMVKTGADAVELAGKLGLDDAALAATIEAYNEDIAVGVDDAFDKPGIEALDGDALYGISLRPASTRSRPVRICS